MGLLGPILVGDRHFLLLQRHHNLSFSFIFEIYRYTVQYSNKMPSHHSKSRRSRGVEEEVVHHHHDDNVDEPVTIRVISPATLAEGYTFDVMVDDAPYTVEVPRGGVKEGQEFEVLYEPHLQDDGYNNSTQVQQKSSHDTEEETKAPDAQETVYDVTTGAPMGRWRKPVYSCCDVLTQSTFWMGLCCTPVLIAQLITRLGLTWRGQTGSKEETSLSFNRILLSMLIVLALWKIPVVGGFIVLFYWLFIMLFVGRRVRNHMRQKYEIPSSFPTRCTSMEDACCMFWCGSCSTIQMARHTHDDKEYPGHGCTTTGLGVDAPEIARAV